MIGLLLKEFEAAGCDWLWAFDDKGAITGPSDRFATASMAEKSAPSSSRAGFRAARRTASSSTSSTQHRAAQTPCASTAGRAWNSTRVFASAPGQNAASASSSVRA